MLAHSASPVSGKVSLMDGLLTKKKSNRSLKVFNCSKKDLRCLYFFAKIYPQKLVNATIATPKRNFIII